MKALLKLGPQRAVQALTRAIQHGSADTRAGAAHLLGSIGTDSAIDLLLELARDPSDEVQYAAISGLAQCASPRTCATLIEALASSHPWIREAAAAGLGKAVGIGEAGDPRAVPALISALLDEQKDVRALAAQSLGHIADPAAIPALQAALDDREWIVRTTAAEALRRIAESRHS